MISRSHNKVASLLNVINSDFDITSSLMPRIFHTADTDKTRLSCFVLSVSAVWTELTENFEIERV